MNTDFWRLNGQLLHRHTLREKGRKTLVEDKNEGGKVQKREKRRVEKKKSDRTKLGSGRD